MDTLILNAAQYARMVRGDAPTYIALGHQLLTATPPKPPPNVKSAVRGLRVAVNRLETVYLERSRVPDAAVIRPLDTLVDASWSALRDRIENCARLPPDRFPLATKAGHLLETLFSGGLTFLRFEFTAQWTAANTLLARIDDEHLADDIDAVAGPGYLAHVRALHVEYGEALGIGRTRPEAPDLPVLTELMREFGNAVVAYALQVITMVDPYDQSDEAEARRAHVRAALRPIDELRAKLGRGGSASASDETATPDANNAGNGGGATASTPTAK